MAEAAVKGEKFEFPDEKDGLPPPEDTLEVTTEGEGDVTIDVVDDTPEEDRGRKVGGSEHVAEVTDDELKALTGDVQKRIKELSFARHDERRAKEAAQRERAELERVAKTALDENKRLKQYVHKGEEQYATTAKAAATAKLDNAKRKYKEAHEAFDADALIAAQQELTTAQMELMRAENFKPTPLQTETDAVYRQPSGQAQPDSRAVEWQQRNQWFGANKRMTAFALAVHQDLVESGLDPRTDDYYKRLDAEIRQTFPPQNGGQSSADSTPPPRKPATVVAPTARSSSAKKIVLTQTQVNLAKKFGLTPEQYAKEMVLLEKSNGR